MTNNYEASISEVVQRIKAAADKSGRSMDSVNMIAVSKTEPLEAIRAAYICGIRNFGENRSDELQTKAKAFVDLEKIRWHFIGTLQSKQAQAVAEYAHTFHAVDREKIARVLSEHLQSINRTMEVFIQVNVSGEVTKHGFDCSDWENHTIQQNTLLKSIARIEALPSIVVQGLMTMAPLNANATEVRRTFYRTKALLRWVNSVKEGRPFERLSMGMSGDFDIAIEEGSTDIRVGSAIFKQSPLASK